MSPTINVNDPDWIRTSDGIRRLRDENAALRLALRELVEASAFAIFGDGEDSMDVAWNKARALLETDSARAV